MDGRKLVGTVALAAACASLGAVSARLCFVPPVMAQGESAMVAREFRVVDRRGATRARLNLTPDDAGMCFELNDVRGTPRISFMVFPDGGPVALFWDKRGGGSYDTRFQTPSINFLDGNNNIRVSLPWTGGVTGARGLPPLQMMPDPGSQPASDVPPGFRQIQNYASPADVQYLRSQIDSLRNQVNQLTARVNLLSQ